MRLSVVVWCALLVVAASCGSGPSAAPHTSIAGARPAAVAPAFDAPVAMVGGRDPEALAVGDVDHDDVPDLVTANTYDDTVSVFLGAGDGSFREAVEFDVGHAPASIALADLDGDGALDLATTNGGLAEGNAEEITGSNDITVLMGRGDGSFGRRSDLRAGQVPMGIGVADLDGDSAADIATVGRHDGRLLTFRGDGAGSFARPSSQAVDGLTLTRRLTLADVNADGVVDALIPEEASGSVIVLLGRGDGGFDLVGSFATGGIEPVAVAAADVNGDASVDLVTANGYPAYDASVLLGTGDGSFQAPQTFETGFAPHSVVVTDLNGDGDVDVATGDVGDRTVSILLGAGDGTFAPPVALPSGSASTNNTIAVADLDGDGAPDVVTSNYKPASDVTVLLHSRPS